MLHSVLQRSSKFCNTFAALGNELTVSDDLVKYLEEFAGLREKDLSEVSYTKHCNKYQNEYKIDDISTLPPCQSALLKVMMSVTYITLIWIFTILTLNLNDKIYYVRTFHKVYLYI